MVENEKTPVRTARENMRRSAPAARRAPEQPQALRDAHWVFDKEIAGLRAVQQRLGASFLAAVDRLEGCRGRVVVCGVGKSGIVAKKIAATLTSTGTPSFYLHPVEAAHGDLGLLAADDVVIVVSYSGANDEFEEVVSATARMRVPLIALTGALDSWIARASQIVIDCQVPEEACPLNLAPTASTTATLAVGDALAVALLQRRGFDAADFAAVHPSGVLGKRLLLTVGEVMRHGDELPCVQPHTSLRNALFVMMEKRLGCIFVTEENGALQGIITDGDLKRILVRDPEGLQCPVHTVMVPAPKCIEQTALAVQALRRMEENPGGAITQLAVVDAANRLLGAVHLHDIVRLGLATAPPPP
ncbi:MAG TPA: KpsF/GutQ family sugar-phosphate isomerase [Candidatus Krumholzibacteria bacterium]|nr:KpsF/GutQ family sugar-phosphate isomerase [Candidatus Krumholzibacteria bacterium]